MSHHLTPERIAELYELKLEEVVRFCDQQSIPIWHGRIDRTLFEACWKRSSA